MRTNDIRDELQDGVEDAKLPPIGMDGGFQPEPPKLFDPPPRLCEQGPCVNYHRMAIVMDSAKPKGDHVDDDGRIVGPAPEVRDHLLIHHYCYPTPGIETRLGSLPVVECNRWSPLSRAAGSVLERYQDDFLETDEGKAYRAELTAWADRQEKATADEQATIDEAARVIADAEKARASAQPTDTTPETPEGAAP